ncbi:MAG: hypothetical protein Fur0037_23200 [Planctomycetota bacterium]
MPSWRACPKIPARVPFLVFSFLALALGPLLVALARKHAWSTIATDSFCVVTISAFALLHMLPECVERGGWFALPLALLGFLAPTLAERGLQRRSPRLRYLVLTLAVAGMAAHDTLDGMGLSLGGLGGRAGFPHARHEGEVLAWAIVLHRIPEGIAIWWIVPRTLGWRAAILILATSVLATGFGFFAGRGFLEGFSASSLSMFQAFLAGSLLHVVLHSHVPPPDDRSRRWHLASFGGALLACFVLWFMIRDHFPEVPAEEGPFAVFARLAAESAPALLLAYVLVGLCQVYIPSGWLDRITTASPLLQALRGVAVGLPLPVCSCGVLPIYRQIVRKGASLGAALAFLVATPELEIAAVLLTWSLMGGEIALMRVSMAALLALGVGIVAGSRHRRDSSGDPPARRSDPPLHDRSVLAALRFGFGPAVDHTASWILLGLLLSAVLVPFVGREWIASLPAGLDIPVAALLGLPIYVCATGSTPLAAMFLSQGLSPGAALAFLLTGPATNVTTFGMIARLHGGRVAFLFASSMYCGAVALGYLANAVLTDVRVDAFAHAAGDSFSPLQWAAMALLALLFAASLLRQGVRPFIEQLFESPANVAEGHDACCDH